MTRVRGRRPIASGQVRRLDVWLHTIDSGQTTYQPLNRDKEAFQ